MGKSVHEIKKYILDFIHRPLLISHTQHSQHIFTYSLGSLYPSIHLRRSIYEPCDSFPFFHDLTAKYASVSFEVSSNQHVRFLPVLRPPRGPPPPEEDQDRGRRARASQEPRAQ